MTKSLEEVNLTYIKKSVFRKILAFFGPAYLISVGYMDPGNWATDIAGGSQFGYALLWVLLMSNIMALLLQSLSPTWIVTQRDFAQASEKPIRHLSIIYVPCRNCHRSLRSCRGFEWQSVSIYCLIFR
jgi:manganese transport protein